MSATNVALTAATLAIGLAMAVPTPPPGDLGKRCAGASGTAFIAGGTVNIGEDGPRHPGVPTQVTSFYIDRTEVTNAQFAAFVVAVEYVTEAERQGEGAVFIQPDRLEHGLDDPRGWWHLVKGASWRHPQGPASDIEELSDRPVVQVTFADAQAYARWRGGVLPTELQWERAARGMQRGPRDPELWHKDTAGKPVANVWDGVFPLVNTREDGFSEIAPVGCYAANDFGLHDLVGNVWEWTRERDDGPGPLRGGSYLCARNYCANHRPAGFQIQEKDLATSHVGFRLVYSGQPSRGPGAKAR